MVACRAAGAALRREEAHVVALLKAAHAEAARDVELRVEGGLGRFVGDELDGPEEAAAWEGGVS